MSARSKFLLSMAKEPGRPKEEAISLYRHSESEEWFDSVIERAFPILALPVEHCQHVIALIRERFPNILSGTQVRR